MSLVGNTVTILDARDVTKRGRRGEVVMETANTLRLKTAAGDITVEKAGTVIAVDGRRELVAGDDIRGRLEDRLRATSG